jgi:hypothetical protein
MTVLSPLKREGSISMLLFKQWESEFFLLWSSYRTFLFYYPVGVRVAISGVPRGSLFSTEKKEE